MSENSLLERVTAAAEERKLSHNSLLTYRCTLAKNHRLGDGRRPRRRNLAPERVGDFDEEAARGRSASHHLQVQAALALLYQVLGSIRRR